MLEDIILISMITDGVGAVTQDLLVEAVVKAMTRTVMRQTNMMLR